MYVTRSRWTIGRLGGAGRFIFISEEMSGLSTFLTPMSRVCVTILVGIVKPVTTDHYGEMNCDSVRGR